MFCDSFKSLSGKFDMAIKIQMEETFQLHQIYFKILKILYNIIGKW